MSWYRAILLVRVYYEIYLKPDSHKTQQHEGELKANGKSIILGHLSIFHSWLKLRGLVAVSSPFSGQNWSEVTVVFLLIFHYTRFSLQKTISSKSLCQMSVKQSTITCWSVNFHKKLNRSGIARFFPVKSFSKTDSALII